MMMMIQIIVNRITYYIFRKNMLLDITVSPCSRVTMFFYMFMQEYNFTIIN